MKRFIFVSAAQRRARKQRLCASLSLVFLAGTVVFYFAFAYLHDLNADIGAQASLAAAAAVSLVAALGALLEAAL